ncbi:ubiquitin-like small modifier protein 1 [Actinokineospora xionganensis]|uniref:MoaD/ThiS family protein n=1 Tax=Actinokineospora xionganensis TaxID=2684470 RepID=A0ABR7KZT2_9PSEU|nr:ubiquitin-like small modifier protein 1 [Actinokineospora xionganensis]MBC6445940.1 MoaD/ThiS family protein [Actinokineospora xionganensis]
MTRVLIPTIMRAHTDGSSSVEASGSTVAEVIRGLVEKYPGLQPKVYDAEGKLQRHLLVVLNGDDVRSLDGTETPVADRDELQLLPAMAGG